MRPLRPPPGSAPAEKLKTAKEKIEKVEKVNIKGMQVRARAKWCEQGEKSFQYILNFEKYRGDMKIFTKNKNRKWEHDRKI